MTSRPRHPMPIMRRLLLPQPLTTGRPISLINRVSVASRSAAHSLIAERLAMSVCLWVSARRSIASGHGPLID